MVCGGVAQNEHVRTQLARVAAEKECDVVFPSPALCTDNAVMIGWTALERLYRGFGFDSRDMRYETRLALDRPTHPLKTLAMRGSRKSKAGKVRV